MFAPLWAWSVQVFPHDFFVFAIVNAVLVAWAVADVLGVRLAFAVMVYATATVPTLSWLNVAVPVGSASTAVTEPAAKRSPHRWAG